MEPEISFYFHPRLFPTLPPMPRLLTLLMLLVPSTSLAQSFLVENGQPRAEIVIARPPLRTVRLAAHELQTHIKLISGAKLPISYAPTEGVKVQIFVGRSEHTDRLKITREGLKFGAYRMASGDNYLVLLGEDTEFTPIEPWARNSTEARNGQLQQAWDKITGASWGVPEAGMYKHRLRLPGDLGLPEGSTPPGKAPPLEMWGFDERGSLNAVCGYLQGLGVRWYLPGELGAIIPSLPTIPLPKIDQTVHPDFEIRRFSCRLSTVPLDTALWAMRLGMRDPHGMHTAHGLATMTSRDEIYAAHPDWYALYGGKRIYQPGYSKNQLCYSNAELFDNAVRYARAQFDHYHYDAVSIMPPDGYTAICQCPLCAGKDVPEMGSRGAISNHVWDFVNRVAKEIAKTHPGKVITNCAYGIYTSPPTNIDKLEPNVQVVIVGGRRPRSSRPEQQVETRELREAWAAKTDRPIMIFENYPITGRGWYLPAFVARTIGDSVNDTKGKSRGEDIWLSFGPTFESEDLGFNHFQVYFTARMYWGGKQQDPGALLAEYCRLFYGPAAAEMLAFFNYCEGNWDLMEADKSKVDAALDLFSKAQAKVNADTSSSYFKRVALVDDFLKRLRQKGVQLAQQRGKVPTLRMVGDANKDIVIDGRLDDDYWQNCPAAATVRLRELQTGRAPTYGTEVKAGWSGSSVYFGIRCDEKPGEQLNIAATRKEDAAIWYGDLIELLIATDAHSYYQIAINPAGAVVDYDRGAERKAWSGWASQAEVATHLADDHWIVEIRIPVTSDENDPLNALVGRKPTQSLPWFINICRQRVRDNVVEASAFSPTGQSMFHDTMKFAHFYAGRSHQFAADPTVTDFLTATHAASELMTSGRREEALNAYIALTADKITDLQKSFALKQAAACARLLKDFARAEELAAKIPLESEKQNAVMQNLLAQRKHTELLERFGQEDLGNWPFWAAGEAYLTRGRAYVIAGDAVKAKADLQAAQKLTTDKRTLADIQELLNK